MHGCLSKAFLPDETAISQVRLRTANLERLLPFYTETLGLEIVKQAKEEAVLSAVGDSPAILLLSEEPGATPHRPRTIGLYHFALRFPDRAALARVYTRLRSKGYPIEGASDHGVSEALYFSDPDNNGIELYADRPRAQWRWRDGQVAMMTKPLDLEGLLAASSNGHKRVERPQSRIGHIHLHVSDLGAAQRFYHEYVGLAVTQRDYPGALFFAAGGYHHHVGVNTWGGSARPIPGSAGLISFRLNVREREILYCLAHRAPLFGYDVVAASAPEDGELLRVRDPDGNIIEFKS